MKKKRFSFWVQSKKESKAIRSKSHQLHILFKAHYRITLTLASISNFGEELKGFSRDKKFKEKEEKRVEQASERSKEEKDLARDKTQPK